MQRYDFRQQFDLEPAYPILHELLENYLATYVEPERGLMFHAPLGDGRSFPTPEEVEAQVPNSQGWYTAIEDCSFLAGLTLWALGRSDCGLTPERRREVGGLLFHGASLLWSIPGTGFVARGICPGSDAFYQNTSPDQVPNYLRGLWAWATSDAATGDERRLAADIFRSVLGRLESHGWELRRADGTPGVSSSGNIGHIGPRNTPQFLAMFAMAHDLTGEGRWMDLLRRFRDEHHTARLHVIAADDSPTWKPWQLELFIESARVLDELDPDIRARAAYRQGIRRMGVLASTYLGAYYTGETAVRTHAPRADRLPVPPAVHRRYGWREGYRRSIEEGLDLTVRRGQVLQGRIIDALQCEDPDRPAPDGRMMLVDVVWALTVVGHAGLPWSSDGVRVQGDIREHWFNVADDVLALASPDVAWHWGTTALLSFFSAWQRRAQEV